MIKKILDQNLLVLYPNTIDLTKPHPVIIMLHGIGECANDSNADTWLSYLISNGPQKFIQAAQQTYKGTDFITIMPQLQRWDINDTTRNRNYTWPARYVDKAIAYAKANYQTTVFSLAGLSLGGGGVLNFITESQANASLFNVAVACCPVAISSGWENIVKAKLQTAFYHAQDDITVSYYPTMNTVNTINNDPATVKRAVYNFPQWGGHYVWDIVFDPAANPFNNGVNAWDMFAGLAAVPVIEAQPVPPPPVAPPATTLKAVVPADTTIPKGSTSFVLNGTGSAGTGAWWEQVGLTPSKVWFTGFNKDNFSVTANGLVNGDYTFKLTVQDKYDNRATALYKVSVGATASTPAKTVVSYLVTPIFSDGTQDAAKTLKPGETLPL